MPRRNRTRRDVERQSRRALPELRRDHPQRRCQVKMIEVEMKTPTVTDRILATLVSAVILGTMPVVAFNDWPGRLMAFVLGGAVMSVFVRIVPRNKGGAAWSSISPVARCGVPLAAGGFCMEPASPGCCYCDLHADWPQDRPKGGAS
jgi:hypothetical protein